MTGSRSRQPQKPSANCLRRGLPALLAIGLVAAGLYAISRQVPVDEWAKLFGRVERPESVRPSAPGTPEHGSDPAGPTIGERTIRSAAQAADGTRGVAPGVTPEPSAELAPEDRTEDDTEDASPAEFHSEEPLPPAELRLGNRSYGAAASAAVPPSLAQLPRSPSREALLLGRLYPRESRNAGLAAVDQSRHRIGQLQSIYQSLKESSQSLNRKETGHE